ncbi:hypothetical protein [Sinomonas sp. P10A9]|uniref:Membrane protein DUF2306 n=1 Tax=Sinomonas puerhi TaxID=3238584 RepID=A0AB39L578_9MICC
MRTDSSPLGQHPQDLPAGIAGYMAAGLGIVAVAALGAMYAVEVPRGGPYIFGGINDFTGGLFFLAAIPPIIQVHRRLGDGPWSRTALAATAAGSVAAAASGILISFHMIPFGPSTAVSMVGIIGQALWAAVANHKLANRPRYPRRLAQWGRAIGLGMLVALPIVGAGYAAGAVPALQTVLYAVGGAIGGAAYLGWPLWLLAVGRRLAGRTEGARRRPAARPA